MKTWYIVLEKGYENTLVYHAYPSKLAFYLHVASVSYTSFTSADDCERLIRRGEKNKKFKRVIVETIKV
jgi:hypothetical protein